MTDEPESNELPDADALWKPGSAQAVAPSVSDVDDEPDAPLADRDQAGSPWRSGSDAVFAETSTPAFAVVDALTPAPPAGHSIAGQPGARRVVRDGEVIALASPGSGRRRWIAVGLVVVLAVAAAAVGRSVLNDDSSVDGDLADGSTGTDVDGVGEVVVTDGEIVAPLVTEPFAGADRRRLPAQLEQQWRVDIEGVAATGRTRLSVLDDGSVVGVFDDGDVDDGEAASVVALLDGADGSEQWRTPFDSEARAFELLGSFGDVIVFERLDTENRAVVGLSADSGDVLWVRDTNDPGVHVAVEGTQLIARVSFTVNARLTFLDPSSGDEVGRVPGRLFATDYLGTWYVRNGSAVSKLDLRDGWNPPTPFDTLWVKDNEPATVVGERLIVVDDGILEIRGSDGEPTSVATIGAGSGGFAGLDTGVNFTQLAPMVGNSFVLSGPRSVFGADLDENGDADVRWRATGTPIEYRPTDRGLSLVLATDGGASQWVIDASTGREIVVVETARSIDALQVVGNGVVVKQSARVGSERVGLDLDGNRLWSLVGDGPLAIGPGVVVTFGPSDSGVAVTAYGDPAA
ncbi:MAG: hypothetical protein WA964_01695 [Ilumatobacter sp.]|uniref:hypothetical protein n=1 Tax=Ilumatobacter sp. TaxID=1967498 RepID=UPI003C71CF8A